MPGILNGNVVQEPLQWQEIKDIREDGSGYMHWFYAGGYDAVV